MGWDNPPVPFRELRDRYEGKAPDPRAEAPVSRRKRLDEVTVPGPDGPVTPYAELHCHSHFSFLDGASSPVDLVTEAIGLGLHALAITDHDGFQGAPAMAEAAKTHRSAGGPPLRTVYGAELSLGLTVPQLGVADPEGTHLLVLARGLEGYHRLAGAITEAQLRGDEKGRPLYDLDELAERAEGHWLILTGCRKGFRTPPAIADLVDRFGRDNVVVELTDRGLPDDSAELDALHAIAIEQGLQAVATGNVHYGRPDRHRLAAAMAAIRARRSVMEMDGWLPPPTAHLRSGAEMERLFHRFPGVVARSVTLADECAFDLQKAKPELPMWNIPEGLTPTTYLRDRVEVGFQERYAGTDLEPAARVAVEKELDEIRKKGFEGYFVIVHDIVMEAKRRKILYQGRGSAAASVVCFVLGITVIDPVKYHLPFERFLSPHRDEEPDIDVDFDARRREEIIQWVYERYGRRNAAQVANVISYRPKMAVRDAAKALGHSPGQQDAWSKQVHSWTKVEAPDGVPQQVLDLASELLKAPRHLGIHSGGMVLTDRPIGEVVPIERARMEARTVLQWDKDACEYMGLVKFDLLGLGMLSALDHMMTIVNGHLGEEWSLATVPIEEPAVYDMLCRADSVGVFQVESRAQIGTLPRLRPRQFYDLVIEIALIRPGPIQGGAVHPYIDRAMGKEETTYAHRDLAPYEVLGRTRGVPLFQEQVIEMGRVLGDLKPEDADLLRRAMGSKRGVERIETLEEQLYAGMAKRGIIGEKAMGIYAQIQAFASFGFAESHALSFAKLVYASSWFKLHYPAAFLAALLRAQPMGFYSPQSLVQDALRHGVEVRGPDLLRSAVVADLEPLVEGGSTRSTGLDSCLHDWPADRRTPWVPWMPDPVPWHRRDAAYAVRLGLDAVEGIGAEVAARIVAARERQPFADVQDLSRRAGLERKQLEALAAAGAFGEAFGMTRREALWESAWSESEQHLEGLRLSGETPRLPTMDATQTMLADLWSTGVTPDGHPMAYIRERMSSYGITSVAGLAQVPRGMSVVVGGAVTHRQRPGTAGGVTFLNLEDETGMLNVVVYAKVWGEHRKVAASSVSMIIKGRLERADGVTNLIAEKLGDLQLVYPEAAAALALRQRSRDFR